MAVMAVMEVIEVMEVMSWICIIFGRIWDH
jgi:hypothetical protein